VSGAIVLAALVLRDGAAAAFHAYADYKVRKAKETPDPSDDAAAEAQAKVFHAVADRIAATHPDEAAKLRAAAGTPSTPPA
jgi:hypothetical protein